ncbi:SOR/SNZ family-domain-containing protein [Pholiota molesta]|nr:SOR/SNZ family-domain-containing protein [Pholiota molesta]
MSTPASGTPVIPASLQSPPIPQGAGSASIPSTAPARVGATQRDGGNSLATFGVRNARIAEEAGACAVMALERVPADIRAEGGVARMSDPEMIKKIVDAVTIPVMAKVRIGHFVEAQILQAIGVDYIDESEVLTPADDEYHINKHPFKVPFVCGARDLGEALRPGTGNVVEAVRHQRAVMSQIRQASVMNEEELYVFAKKIGAPFHLLKETARLKRLPVVNFAAGGVATPADAALMMQLGCDGVFVGSGIFHSGDPAKRARAIVQAVTHYNNYKILAEVSETLVLPCDSNLKGGNYAQRGQ